MGQLSHIIDPRFLTPLARALACAPHTELELRTKFLRDVPNRLFSQRLLQILLDLARRGGLIILEQGTWRTVASQDLGQLVSACISSWCDQDLHDDPLLRNRSAVFLDRGTLLPTAEYVPLPDVAQRSALADSDWARLISGPCDLRQLTGRSSKHTDADSLMLYRSASTFPITDDPDVVPRIPRSMLPQLPSRPDLMLSALRKARAFWSAQLSSFLGEASPESLSGFIVYAKDLLDTLLWGASAPLRSLVSPEHLALVAEKLQRFGLRAEDLSTIWRALPSTYRLISRLSWGERYLSNNLSHPHPPEPDPGAFIRICSLPPEKQSAISASRSGHTLLTLVRPLRVLHRALLVWRGRPDIASAVEECETALAADMREDKLLRREFAERIKRLNVVAPLSILDALALPMSAPTFPTYPDQALTSASLIATYSSFLESRQGHACAELRLALHAELDFHNRFNRHAAAIPQRYAGIWRGTIEELVTRVEDLRKACIPV